MARPKRASSSARASRRSTSASSSSTISGISRICRATPLLVERGLHALVDQPLVRGVLVDDDEAVAGLRHDVGVVHLRARGAERPVEQVGRGLGDLDAGGRPRPRRRRTPPARLRQSPVGRAQAASAPRGGSGRDGERRQSHCRARGSGGRAERRDGRGAAGRSPRAGRRARAPPCSACISSARTRPLSRKRTSVLAGCTFTSTSRGGERHEQRHHRMAVARQIVGIGAAHDADQQLVAHRAAVDEEILPERVGAAVASAARHSPRPRRRRARPRTSTALARKSAPSTSASRASRPGRAGQRRGPGHRRALLAGEREGDVRPAHGEPAHHLAHGLGFAAVALEEFQPRRRRVEQVARPRRGCLPTSAAGLIVGLRAGIDGDRPGVRLAGVARRDRQPRHRADRGQRLAAEAERADLQQIVAVELGGGVALDREREVGPRHAGAVVGDADQPAAAAVGRDLDPRRAGVERVLDQFLDHARRPLDHLAGGDAVDQWFRKAGGRACAA